MKKWLMLSVFILGGTAAQAEDTSDWNKQKFIEQNMKWAENNPKWNPTEIELAAKFQKLDTDGNGVLSYDERQAGKKKKKG